MSDNAPTAADLKAYAQQLAAAQGLDPDFVTAIGQQESGWQPGLVSKAGAQGPMQLMPATAKMLGVDPTDPYDNIRGGVNYLKHLSDQFNGDPALTAAAYNAGPGAVKKAGGVPNYPETQNYVNKVTTASIDPAQIDWGNSNVPTSLDASAPDASQIAWGAQPAAAKPAEDLNAIDNYLPSTLSVAGLDTGIPLAKPIGAAILGAGKATARISQGISQVGNWLSGNKDANDQLSADVAAQDKAYAPVAQAHPLATGIGESLPAFAIPIGGAGGVVGAMGRAAAANALPGALSYGDASDRLKSAAIGGAGGAVGAGLGGIVGRVLNPFRAVDPVAANEIAATAAQHGITLTPPQYTGSKPLSGLYSTMATFPGSAGVMAKVNEGQATAFNRAALATMGEGGLLGEEGAIPFNAAGTIAKNFGPKFDNASAGVQIPTSSLLDGLANVDAQYGKNISPLQKPQVDAYISGILDNGPAMSGETYQATRSRVGALANSTGDSEFKGALKGIQQTLDAGYNAAAPADQAAQMALARGQYANFKTLQPLIEKASLSTDNLSPAQVAGRAMASGNMSGQMGQLAQLGSVLKDYPNSGTAPRMMWQKILENPSTLAGGAGFAEGQAEGGPSTGVEHGLAAAAAARAFPWLLAKAVTSGAGNAYLSRGLLSISPATENLLTRYGGLLGYAGSNVAQQH